MQRSRSNGRGQIQSEPRKRRNVNWNLIWPKSWGPIRGLRLRQKGGASSGASSCRERMLSKWTQERYLKLNQEWIHFPQEWLLKEEEEMSQERRKWGGGMAIASRINSMKVPFTTLWAGGQPFVRTGNSIQEVVTSWSQQLFFPPRIVAVVQNFMSLQNPSISGNFHCGCCHRRYLTFTIWFIFLVPLTLIYILLVLCP